MKKEIADKWVKALRSGEYKQGRGLLRDKDDNFCCLGVLCDLAVKEGIVTESQFKEGDGRYTYGNTHNFGSLPKEVQNWAGMNSNDGFFLIDNL